MRIRVCVRACVRMAVASSLSSSLFSFSSWLLFVLWLEPFSAWWYVAHASLSDLAPPALRTAPHAAPRRRRGTKHQRSATAVHTQKMSTVRLPSVEGCGSLCVRCSLRLSSLLPPPLRPRSRCVCVCICVVLQAIVLVIAGLGTSLWYKCTFPGSSTSLQFELTHIKQYQDGQLAVSVGSCDDQVKQSLYSDVPCKSGQLAMGLGIVGIFLLAFGVAFSAMIAMAKRAQSFWIGSMTFFLLGGIAALIGGAAYIGLISAKMSDVLSGASYTCNGEAGSILLIVGGLVGIAAASLHCTCCCPDKSA